MPTYEYACKSCGQHLEVVQSFMDDPLAECPACGGTLRKVFGNIGIAFKGSGFYRTDNRSDGRKGKERAATSRDSSPGAKSDGAGTTKSESSAGSGSSGSSGSSSSSGSGASSSSSSVAAAS